MVEINLFPPDIYQTLIALPYRVGLFVSMSDRTGGEDADAKEIAALENVVTFYVEDTLKSEFAQSVMLATLQHKAVWNDWQNEIEKVPAECAHILGYLEDRLDSRALIAFKNNLLEIAIAVAMAYRETSAAMSFLTKIKNCLTFRPKQETANSNSQFLNISPSEKIAINELAATFGINYKVG